MNGPQPETRITGTGMEVQVLGPDGAPEWRPVLSVTLSGRSMGIDTSEINPLVAENERVLRSDTGAIHIVQLP